MRSGILAVAFLLGMTPGTWAQGESVFDDVAPWHWAYDGVQKVGSAGIFVGYPTDDSELLANALTQVYDAFAHATHPAARNWAERFLINTPPTWPRPLQQSRVLQFSFGDLQIDRSGDEARIAVAASVIVRTDTVPTTIRSTVLVAARKDSASRWRIDYTSLAASQPQVFR